MATLDEIWERAEKMDEQRMFSFRNSFHMQRAPTRDLINTLLVIFKKEAELCSFFGLPTEDEKARQASIDSAASAKISAVATAQAARSAEEANQFAEKAKEQAAEAIQKAEDATRIAAEAAELARTGTWTSIVALVVAFLALLLALLEHFK
jgi:hypothetical protein